MEQHVTVFLIVGKIDTVLEYMCTLAEFVGYVFKRRKHLRKGQTMSCKRIRQLQILTPVILDRLIIPFLDNFVARHLL